MIELHQGDCLELMKDIPDGSVDMVCCDLPYGVTRNAWDKPIPFEPLWGGYWRICKPDAAIVLFSQMPFTADLIYSQRDAFKYEWIYQKSIRVGFLNANRAPLKIHENICVFYRKLPTYNPQYWYDKPYAKTAGIVGKGYGKTNKSAAQSVDGRRYPVDIIKFKNTRCGNIHPTQKPVPLLEYLIKTYTNAGETVLDNCMGSGTTGVAAVNTGRNFIGMELDSTYFEAAKRRIEDAITCEKQIQMEL